MADRIENFRITQPAGDNPGDFTSTLVSFDPGIVTAVIIHVPSGHAGLTGIQIAYNDDQIIPAPPRVYYRGNKRTLRRELSEEYPANGNWFVQVFNGDKFYAHTWDVEFEVDALDLTGGRLPLVLFLPTGAGADDTVSGGTVTSPTPAPSSGRIVPV